MNEAYFSLWFQSTVSSEGKYEYYGKSFLCSNKEFSQTNSCAFKNFSLSDDEISLVDYFRNLKKEYFDFKFTYINGYVELVRRDKRPTDLSLISDVGMIKDDNSCIEIIRPLSTSELMRFYKGLAEKRSLIED